MAMTLTFTVAESAGGTYLTFTDTSPWGVDANPTIYTYSGGAYEWTITLTYNEQDYEYKLTAPSHAEIDELVAGLQLSPSDFTFIDAGTDELINLDSFPDEKYDFIYTVDALTSASKTYGFYALVAGAVMKDSLGYQPEAETFYKNTVNEKVRLLTNLDYALVTGDIESFQENLYILQNLVVV